MNGKRTLVATESLEKGLARVLDHDARDRKRPGRRLAHNLRDVTPDANLEPGSKEAQAILALRRNPTVDPRRKEETVAPQSVAKVGDEDVVTATYPNTISKARQDGWSQRTSTDAESSNERAL